MLRGAMDSKQYVYWVDYAKIMGIYLVTLGHCELVNPDITQFIYSFHMPLFFVLSGMLYHRRSLKETARKNLKSLIIPYITINLICFLYYNIIFFLNERVFDSSRAVDQIYAILLGLGYKTAYFIPVCTTMWFVIALLIIIIIVSCLRSVSQLFFLTFFSILLSLLFRWTHFDTWIPIDSACLAIPFFTLGYSAKCRIMGMLHIKLWELVIFSISLMSACYMLNVYNGRVDINTCLTGNSMIVFYFAGLTGSFSIILFAMVFEKTFFKLGRPGGGNYVKGLFLIMGFNLIAIGIVEKIIKMIVPSIHGSSVLGMIEGLIVLVGFCPIIYLCRKYFPAIIGFR